MRIRGRKIVIFAVAAALAAANGFAPRHAQAATHAHSIPVAKAGPQHHNTGQEASHHHGGVELKQMTVKVACYNNSQDGNSQGIPNPHSSLHNCCVASCSAVAFLFANMAFDHALPDADYVVSPDAMLIATTVTFDDPPPR